MSQRRTAVNGAIWQMKDQAKDSIYSGIIKAPNIKDFYEKWEKAPLCQLYQLHYLHVVFQNCLQTEILNTPQRESSPDIFHSNTDSDVKNQEIALNSISSSDKKK